MFRNLALTCALAALGASAPAVASAQTPPRVEAAADPAISQFRAFGEVVAVDLPAGRLTLRTEAGNELAVSFDAQTEYLRLPPGETTLERAVKTAAAEVAAGDRVFVRGRVAEDRRSVPARAVVVMNKAELAQRQQRERAQWRERGISGVVAGLQPATREITLQTGAGAQVIAAGGAGVRFRRYAPDSVKFEEARPSSFDELKVGDQVRALGAKSPDGARFVPDEVVSGSFRTVGGVVTGVDAAAGEVKITDLVTRQPLTVVLGAGSTLRRLPPEMTAALAGAMKGGDARQTIAGLPTIEAAHIKPGVMILVSSVQGADPSRARAVLLLAGVEPLLQPLLKSGQPPRSLPNLGNMSMGGQ